MDAYDYESEYYEFEDDLLFDEEIDYIINNEDDFEETYEEPEDDDVDEL